jgi:hypothetical protein
MLTDTVCGKKLKEVNTARSELLRLLLPQDTDDSSETIVDQLKTATSNAKAISCLALAEKFFAQGCNMFWKSDSLEQHDQLVEVMQKADKISTKLCTQRSGLNCQVLSDLPPTFDHTARDMEAHWLHNEEWDDNSEALNGRPILLVTHPAVIAIGKSDGSDYDVRRVLKKAIVWMG